MPIMSQSSNGKDFEPAPEGKVTAVVCDVIDKGYEETPWGSKHKIQVIWQVDALNAEGKPYEVRKYFTNSLFKGSNLRAMIEDTTGKAFREDSPKPIDLEQLVGKSCVMLLVHKTSKADRVYALPKSIMPTELGLEIKGYVREKDKAAPQEPEYGKVKVPEEPPAHTDEDFAF